MLALQVMIVFIIGKEMKNAYNRHQKLTSFQFFVVSNSNIQMQIFSISIAIKKV